MEVHDSGKICTFCLLSDVITSGSWCGDVAAVLLWSMGGLTTSIVTPRLSVPWGAAICWEMMVFKHGSLAESPGG